MCGPSVCRWSLEMLVEGINSMADRGSVSREEFGGVDSLSIALGEILSIFLDGQPRDVDGIAHSDARRTLERLRSHHIEERSRLRSDESFDMHTDAPQSVTPPQNHPSGDREEYSIR